MPIVTPNWDLPTPALTDAYNLVGDLATFASAVDGALTTAGTARRGTEAQRIAYTASATNGMLWQDTSGIKMIWRKDGAAWVPAVTRWSGTTAQMNSFTQAPNGFGWYSTTSNAEFVRRGTLWVRPTQHGTVAKSVIAPGSVTNTTITFPVPFASTPVVQATVWGDARDAQATVDNITATSFILRRGSNSLNSRTLGAQWTATA